LRPTGAVFPPPVCLGTPRPQQICTHTQTYSPLHPPCGVHYLFLSVERKLIWPMSSPSLCYSCSAPPSFDTFSFVCRSLGSELFFFFFFFFFRSSFPPSSWICHVRALGIRCLPRFPVFSRPCEAVFTYLSIQIRELIFQRDTFSFLQSSPLHPLSKGPPCRWASFS